MSQESKSLGLSVVIFAVIGAVVLLVMAGISPILRGSKQVDMSANAVAARIKPVGELNTGAPMVASAGAEQPAASSQAASTPAAAPAKQSADSNGRSGQDVYNKVCMACHTTGAAGAPMLGKKDAWAPRIQQGMDTLVGHAINGFKAMPPRGTCADCSDEDLRKAVQYMVSQSD